MTTKKELLEFGKYLTGEDQEEELSKYLRANPDDEFLFIGFGLWLVGDLKKVKHEWINWTTQIEDYNKVFKDV